MFKKLTSVFLILMTIVFSFSACSGGENKDIYHPLYSDPVSFDPQIASDNASKIVVFNCFEGLVKADRNGKIIPGVAKSWSISPDGLVYTFHLRTDSKWYMSEYAKKLLDEKQAENFNYHVIAEDFVYGLQRAFDASMGSVTDARLYSIKNAYEVFSGAKAPHELGVTAINDSTLKIELSEPDGDFLYALTQTAAMPCRKEFFLATKGRYGLDPEKVIYNGPFYLYSWSAGSNLTLFRNENYVGEEAVKPSAVYLYINDNLHTRVEKLDDGTYDACPFSIRQKNISENNKNTYISYNNSTWGFFFNCSSNIMKDYYMRTALTSSIDITQLPLPEHCEKYADGIVPEICMANGKTYRNIAGKIKTYKPDKEKVQTNLEKAFENLELNRVEIKLICDQNFENTVKLAVQKWQNMLGVDVSFVIEPLDEVALKNRLTTKDYDIAFTKITAESESVLSFLGMFTSANVNNFISFESEKYDDLMGKSDSPLNQSQVFSNCIKAEQHLVDMSVVIPVFYEESYLAMAKNVSDVYSVEAGTIPIFINAIRK